MHGAQGPSYDARYIFLNKERQELVSVSVQTDYMKQR